MNALSFCGSEPSKVSGSLTLVWMLLGQGLFNEVETPHNRFMNSCKKSCLLGGLLGCVDLGPLSIHRICLSSDCVRDHLVEEY